ncbi:flagellar hook-length control protein FliK [Profundibacter sp.]|uniref:flagellar hook-length control protein FliK n=1 Tax=Profundibacter sp. TaxID=3101071 RepID=UPI003D0CC5CF
MPERPVELTLNPHELGRVRLTFTLTDGGINVAVLAERGETMDLMRRHIETLAQEFRDMGYADVGFQFSQHDRENAGGNNPDAQTRHAAKFAPPTEIENIHPARVSLEPSNGLDLRL